MSPGTSGYVLTSTGTGWVSSAPAGGGGGTNLTITSVISTLSLTIAIPAGSAPIQACATALNSNMDIPNPTGTAGDGQRLLIRIKDAGTTRLLTYGSQFRAIGCYLPVQTVPLKTTYIGCLWNAAPTILAWDVVSVTTQF